ncbi:MAG TPA: Gfo/Idh/MocA family oxidoreductase, partial [Anaerolineae bacterium]
MLRMAVVGAGWMARVRVRALIATGQVELCGVAARHTETAQTMAREFSCEAGFDDYRQLVTTHPDFLLVEVPHQVQDDVVLWGLEQGLHVFIGGTMATTTRVSKQIQSLVEAKKRVVESGYEARYNPAWEGARDLIHSGALGRLVTVRT